MNLKSIALAQSPDAKAIVAHPALTSGEPQLVVRDANNPRRVAFGQREAARHLEAYGGKNDSIDWVVSCVKLISETASEANWHFEKDGEKLLNYRRKESPTDAKVAPLMAVKLFEEPNPYMDWAEHIELTIIDYLMVGNAYWLHWRQNESGQPLALYRLSPRHVKVVPGVFGVEAYEYQLPEMREPMRIKPEEITHFRQANPHNQHFGLGHIQGASRMLDLELALTNTQASYFENHAQPSMVVQSDRRVPDAVFRKLKSQLKAMYSGPRNAGSMMILEAGLKYQAISPSASEAAFESLSKLSRDRILSLFRVPGVLLGINSSGSDSASNITSAQRIFDTKTMRPLLDKMQKAISRSISQAWDLDFIIEYDYIMPIEDRIKLTSSFASIPGVKLGEVREYAGLPLLGDERDDLVLNLPGEEVDPGYHPDIADRNLNGEGGRPPKGENTAAFPEPGQQLPSGAKVSGKALSLEDALARIEAKAVKLEQDYRTDIEARIVAPDDVLKADREAEVDLIAADLRAELTDAAHSLERSLLDHVEGKAGGTIYQRIKKSEAWKAFQERVTESLEKASKRALSAAVVQQGRLGIFPEEDVDYDALAKALIHDKDIGGKSITDTLKKRIGKYVLEIQQKQGTQDQLEQAVREAISVWKDSNADTIALTNLTHAYNEGVLTAAELAGYVDVYVHDGDDHDQPCQDANGQVWTLEHARANRLEHPNCRRGFTILTDPTVA